MRFVVTALAVVAMGSPQAAPDRLETFDVVSIKPSDPSNNDNGMRFSPGRFIAHGFTVASLIENAYDLRPSQISGCPGWAESSRYDIQATVQQPEHGQDASLGPLQRLLQGRLQALLGDRFKLRVHQATKQGSVYGLMPAKSGAVKIEASPDPDAAHMGIRMGVGQVVAQNFSMAMLASFLSGQVDQD